MMMQPRCTEVRQLMDALRIYHFKVSIPGTERRPARRLLCFRSCGLKEKEMARQKWPIVHSTEAFTGVVAGCGSALVSRGSLAAAHAESRQRPGMLLDALKSVER